MRLGVVVDSRHVTSFERAIALGASALSVRIRPGQNQRPFLKAAHADHNLAVLGTLGRDSFRARLDWRGSAEADIDHIMSLVEAGLLDAVAIGHEPDDGFAGGSDDPLVAPRGGVGSWVLPLGELAELITMLRARMREIPFPVPLVLGGLCSWHPEILDSLDLALLDGILVHPYGAGRQPETTLGAYLDALVAILAERGLTNRVRLGIGELGHSDQMIGRGEVADWFSRMLAYLDGRGDIDCCFICCDSDLVLDGYGQFDIRERAKPSVASIFDVALRLPAQDPLFKIDLPDPTPEESGDPVAPPAWDDPYFSPEQIAQAMAEADGHQGPSSLTEPIRALWPEFSPYLTQFQVPDDPAARSALLAALYVATAGRLVPTVEGGSYTRAEQRYGGKRGNRYHGDGWRYRGRGLVRILGRAAYEAFGQALDLPLLEEPDMVLEPGIAAGITALTFQQQHLFEAAVRGNWVEVWRGVDPGLQGYGAFLAVVQALLNSVDATSEPPENVLGPAALGAALAWLGDPYTPGGDRPGGFDGPGLVTWAYGQVREEPLPPTLGAMFVSTAPVGANQAQPGDLVFYEYGDPASGGSRYDHVALLVDHDQLVLDVRAGSGVGYRPHIRGAIRRYRRVTGPGRIGLNEEGRVQWEADRAQLLERLKHLVSRLTSIRSRLDERLDIPERPIDKAQKREWLEWGQRIRQWRERDNEDLNRHVTTLERFEHDLRSLLDWSNGDQESPEQPEEQPEGGEPDGRDE